MLETKRLLPPVLAAGIAAAALAGCGSSRSNSSSTSASTPASGSSGGGYNEGTSPAKAPAASGQQLKLSADEDGGLYFKPKKLKGKAGAVSLVMMNPKTTGKQHGIAVEGNGVDKDGPIVAAGSTSTVTVTLKPGTYTFYCPVAAHKKAGMKGVLTVQ